MEYSKLIQAIPELKEVSLHNKFEIKINGKVPLKITREPAGSTLLFNIDQSFFITDSDKYFTEKFGAPNTAVQQTKRSFVIFLSHLIQPIGSMFLGLKKGDVKVEICDLLHAYRYGVILNSGNKSVRLKYKAINNRYLTSMNEAVPRLYLPTKKSDLSELIRPLLNN